MGGSGSGNRAWGAGYHAGKQEGFSEGSLVGAAGGIGVTMLLWGATWGVGKLKARRERLLADVEPQTVSEPEDAETEGGGPGDK